MLDKENTDRPRREVLIKAGMALLTLITKGVIPTNSSAESNTVDASTKLQNKPDERLKLIAPTTAEFVRLDEYLSFLSHLPAGARVHDAVIAIGGSLDILRDCDLPMTNFVALSLRNSRCHYGCGSLLLSEQSRLGYSKKMIPIRRAFAAEIRNFETRPNGNCLEYRRNKSCSK